MYYKLSPEVLEPLFLIFPGQDYALDVLLSPFERESMQFHADEGFLGRMPGVAWDYLV
jgi:hypothetical protein